jgi:hypothetical protein
MIALPLRNRFGETLLIFRLCNEDMVVDLRQAISPEQRNDLRSFGPTNCFAAITPENAMGQSHSKHENSAANQSLVHALEHIAAARPVDGASPDMSHRESGFAVWVTEHDARQAFQQLAYFWFDGECFWLVYAAVEVRVPLPDG